MSFTTRTRGRRTPHRRRPTTATHVAVGALAVGGALVAMFWSEASPTMSEPVDTLYRGLLAGLCALAGARARRWSLLWASVIATLGAGVPVQFAAAAAAVAALAMLVFRFRDRVLGAAIGAATGVAVLGLERPDRLGATALLAAVAVVPLLVSGLRRSGTATKRAAAIGAGIVCLVLLAGVVGAALFGLGQRTRVSAAVDQTRAALDLAAAQDSTQAAPAFNAAAASFDDVGDHATAWWLLPARLTPVVGANLDFVRTAAGAGANLNRVAADLTTSVDQESLRTPQGGVDLAVLATMQEPVASAVDQIDDAVGAMSDTDSPWLVGPVRDGHDQLTDELDKAADSARTAQLAIERSPSLLGAEGPRRYVMLLGNPAESRDLGGHIGNWAEIVAANGRMDIVAIGQPYDLFGPTTTPAPTLTPGAYPQSLVEMRPQAFPQNWGSTADFPTVAKLTKELFSQARPGAPIDGVVYADPAAFAALLRLTGPEPVPGTDLVLTPDNAEEFLTTGQFTTFATETAANEVVNYLVRDVVERFGTTQLASPTTLADVFGPLVARGSLQFVSFDQADTPLLDRLGLLGAVERPGSGDLLSVLTRNTNPSKIDVYLHRDVEYSVEWNPRTGAVQSKVRVTLTNAAPDSGLPDVVANHIPGLSPGTNRTMVSVLSPWSVGGATLDGTATGVGTQQELRGVRRHTVLVDLPPGATRVLELDLEGSVGPSPAYVLQWIGQPTAVDGDVSVDVRSTSGRLSGGRTSAEWTFDAAEDSLMRVGAPAT